MLHIFSNFLCLLVQLNLRITKSTPIFERVKATVLKQCPFKCPFESMSVPRKSLFSVTEEPKMLLLRAFRRESQPWMHRMQP